MISLLIGRIVLIHRIAVGWVPIILRVPTKRPIDLTVEAFINCLVFECRSVTKNFSYSTLKSALAGVNRTSRNGCDLFPYLLGILALVSSDVIKNHALVLGRLYHLLTKFATVLVSSFKLKTR